MKYTLAFDVYGTLINTSGIYTSLEKMIGEKAAQVMDTWRNKQLEYSFRRGLMNSYVDFSVCTKDALEFSCKSFNVHLSDEQKTMLELSEQDIKTGKLISQEAMNKRNLEWLNAM